MTEKLYYNDAYIKEFEATVSSTEKHSEGYATVLDRTAFFPEEGGQYSDIGFIGESRVIRVYEENGVIYHITDRPYAPGESVRCTVDFDERYEKMQCHTAEHILSGLIHSLYGLNNVGFHLGKEDVTMDISAPLSEAQLLEIERLANEAVYSNVEVTQLFPSEDEAAKMEYRAKLDITEGLRIIKIGDYDSCACCAPHVKRTGEIGSIKIIDYAGLRGGIRIFIAAGRRAQRLYSKMHDNLSRISKLYSVPRLECADAAVKFAADFSALKNEYKAFKASVYKTEGERIPRLDRSAVCVLFDAGYEEMRVFSNAAADKATGIFAVLSESSGSVKYIISSKTVPMNLEIKKINTALNGKGGGNFGMVQGSFNSDLETVVKYFEKEYGAVINPHK